MRIINVSPEFNKRKIFNNRHFERYTFQKDLFAVYNGINYQVLDMSLTGLSLEGDSSIKKNMTLEIPGKSILL